MTLISTYEHKFIGMLASVHQAVTVFGIEMPFTEKQLYANSKQILAYKAFVIGICVMWFVLQIDGSFSSLITLGSATQGFAFLLLLCKAHSTESVAGISRKMLGIYALALMARLNSTLFYLGYLPLDESGSCMYQVLDIMTLCVVLCLFRMTYKYNTTYDAAADSCWVSWMLVGAFILAYSMHPTLNYEKSADMFWTGSLWLEAAAIVPQIWMVSKSTNMDAVSSHFVATSFASRCMVGYFWLEAFEQLVVWDRDPEKGLIEDMSPAYFVVAAFAVQILLMGDFMYYYGRHQVKKNVGAVLAGSLYEL